MYSFKLKLVLLSSFTFLLSVFQLEDSIYN